MKPNFRPLRRLKTGTGLCCRVTERGVVSAGVRRRVSSRVTHSAYLGNQMSSIAPGVFNGEFSMPA